MNILTKYQLFLSTSLMLEKILSQDDKTGFAVLRHNRQKFGALLQSIIGNFKSIIGSSLEGSTAAACMYKVV